MNHDVLNKTRSMLRSRIKRIEKCPEALFCAYSKQLVEWLENHPVWKTVIERFPELSRDITEDIDSIENWSPGVGSCPQFKLQGITSIADCNAAYWYFFQKIAQKTGYQPGGLNRYAKYLKGNNPYAVDPPNLIAEKVIFETVIVELGRYLEERLNSRDVMFAILKKYKQRSEWFHRERFRILAEEKPVRSQAEPSLARDLHEYLFSQHVDFVIEPVSVSGEADLLLKDSEGRYAIADAKYIPAKISNDKIVQKLAEGFHQVFRYCHDFDEPEGFLVPFVETSKRLMPELEESDGKRFLKIGGKTIYYLEVHIADEKSASKSGKADELIIEREELIGSLEN